MKNKNNILLKELDQSKKMLNDLMNNENGRKDGDTEIDKLKKVNMELIEQIDKIKELNNSKINESNALVEEIKNLKNQIEKKDSIIFEFKEQINVRDNIINELKNQISERDNLLKEIKHQLNIKDNIIDELKIQIDEKDGDLKEKENALKSINDQINERDSLIEELKAEIENAKLQTNSNSNAINEEKILLNDIITKTDINDNSNNADANNDKLRNKNQEKNIKDNDNSNANANNNEKKEDKNELKKEVGKKLPPFYNRFRVNKSEEKKELDNNKDNKDINNKNNEDVMNNKETNDETINNKNENNLKKEESLANEKENLVDKNLSDNGDKNIKNDINNTNEFETKNKENENQIIHGKKLEEEKDEVKDAIRKMDRKKNYTYRQKNTALPIDEDQNEIDQISTNQTESKDSKNLNYYLYGIDRSDYFHIFDINNKKWLDKKRISDLKLDEKSTTFKKDYQYEGTILYNTLEGVYILTGEKTDTLYYFNSLTNTITKICKFNNSHDNGSIMYDENENCLYVFGGKKINSCEYYSFNDKQIKQLPDLITDRANASFIISNNKIFGFFGFSYVKNNYSNSIEYINYNKKDKWFELTDISLGQNDISFDVESISTMYYKQNKDQILIYSGIQGDEEDFVTEYYLLYNAKDNIMEKINKWKLSQYRFFGKRWKNYNVKKNDPKGFHFAKNTRFLSLNKTVDGYDEKDIIDVLIDYKNNVHFILQEKELIDIYRGNV